MDGWRPRGFGVGRGLNTPKGIEIEASVRDCREAGPGGGAFVRAARIFAVGLLLGGILLATGPAEAVPASTRPVGGPD